MKTSGIYRKGGTLTACNSQAGRDVSTGIHYTSPIEPMETGFDGRPILAEKVPQNFAHLINKRFGRIQVLGCLKNNPSKLVVRCVCGVYELRSQSQLREPIKKTLQTCLSCLHGRILKGEFRDFFKENPINYLETFFGRFVQEGGQPRYEYSEEEQIAGHLHVTVTVFMQDEAVASTRGVGRKTTQKEVARLAALEKRWAID